MLIVKIVKNISNALRESYTEILHNKMPNNFKPYSWILNSLMQSPHFTGNESIKMVPGTLQQFSQGESSSICKTEVGNADKAATVFTQTTMCLISTITWLRIVKYNFFLKKCVKSYDVIIQVNQKFLKYH